MNLPANRRVLLVDDMPAIHEDFRKILMPQGLVPQEFSAAEAALFGESEKPVPVEFELDSAYQGQEALDKVRVSLHAERPYALAFVDMRMPPGWDGVQTVEHLWESDPRLQVVICTAYSDAGWDEVLERLDARDRLLILKKPFDPVEVYQLARSLTAKWQMAEEATSRLNRLEQAVVHRTVELSAANERLQQELVQRTRDEADLKLAASVFHFTLDGVLIIDPQRHIVSVNPAFERLTGYGAQELVGRPVSMLRSHEHQGPDFYLDMWRALERDGRWEGEFWSRRRDGDAFLGQVNTAMVPDGTGRPSRYVSVFHDITELRRREERIRHQAFHDTLTGLPNRSLLLDRLEQAILAARRDREPLGLMYIDLDRFKNINDTFGHAAGDSLLREMAARLAGCLRKSDTVARIGGDEFVALVRRVERPPNYGLVAQKIIASLSAPVSLPDDDVQVGVSIGVACYPDDGQDPEALMRHADAAMYEAKASGRATYRFFRPEMTDKVAERLDMEMQLRRAVANGELELFYQPQVSLTGAADLFGVEALLRWRHPELGLLPAADFIAIAEASDLIHELGAWALEEACRQARAWRLGAVGGIAIAVNVSGRQLQQRDWVSRIARAVREHRVSPSDLRIELTESALMAGGPEADLALAELRELGVPVAIDHFGTGHSCLRSLRNPPVALLKVDRSFVANAERDESDAQVIRTIVAVGNAMNLGVVAEGVETESQAQFMRSCGCTAAQGYLYARPQPAAQLETWLLQRPGAGSIAPDSKSASR